MTMNITQRRIIPNGTTYRQGEFVNNGPMVQKLRPELKQRILKYLNAPAPGMVGDVKLIDPVTGKVYGHTSILRENDGFIWSTSDIYMLEHYDIKLSDDFLRLFD